MSALLDDLLTESVAENLDALACLDLRGYGVPRAVIRAARELAGGPMIMHAARQIVERVTPGSAVLIATGFMFPPWYTAELEGMVGGPVVANALERALGARPVIVVEPELVPAATTLVRAAGLQPTAELEHWRSRPRTALVRDFTRDEAEARAAAVRLLDEIQPAVVMSIERPGRNQHGEYHLARGGSCTDLAAKLDHCFELAHERGILTVGLGDVGNELGMGRVSDAVRATIPFGAQCACPCEGGIAAVVGADATIVTTATDWGAYGLAAALSYLSGTREALHTADLQRHLMRTAVAAGLVDGSGYAMPAIHGIPVEYHALLVEMLRWVVEQPSSTRDHYRPMFERVLALRGAQS